MKKKIYLSIILAIFSIVGFSQISINTIYTTSTGEQKNEAITIYHSSGQLFHFESSIWNLYVQKIDASTGAINSIAYRLNVNQWGGMLCGGFEDQQGNIIIYGEQGVGGMIMKIDPSNFNILNVKNFYNIGRIIDGSCGEKNSGLITQSFNYSFLSNDGTFIISDLNFNISPYRFGIQNGDIQDISWNSITKKYMATGVLGYNAFFVSFDCKDSYQNEVLFHNKFGFSGDLTTQSGLVLHSLLNNGKIMIAKSGSISTSNYLSLSTHSIIMSPPYFSTIDAFDRIKVRDGYFFNKSMIYNPSNNNLTLNSRIENDEYLFNIIDNGGTISCSQRYLSDVNININNLIYNPDDQLGGVNIGTGILSHVNSYTNCGLFYIHNNFSTSCYSSPSKVLKTSITPNTFQINEIVSPLNNSCIVPNIYFINPVPFFVLPHCSSYHTEIENQIFKEKLASNQNNSDIVLFNNVEFMLTGFNGNVNCQIFDITGKIVYSIISDNDLTNSIPNLSKGIYLLKAFDNKGNEKIIKFIK